MRGLPRLAQVYLILIVLAGIGAFVASQILPSVPTKALAWEKWLFFVLALVAGGKKVRLMRTKVVEDAGSMSLGFAITFTALVRFGPGIGCLVGALSSLSGCIYPKRQPLYQLSFNVALTALESWLAGVVFFTVNGNKLEIISVGSFAAVAGATLIYYAVNTGSVAIIIALCTNQHPAKLWKQTFLWTAPSYFGGASFSSLACLIFGNQIGAVIIFAAPVVLLTYQSYKVYTERAEEKQQHIEELQISQAQLADLYLATIKSLALAIDAKDQYTHQHILRVQRYAVATAKQMGLSGSDLEGVNTGALLHDIGKLGVPEYVLLKPGRLSDEEFAKIKKHPEIGAAILDPVEFPWPVLPAVNYQHAKWDGTGYPEGLAGEDIPLTARILAVGDVYDALTSNRSYRGAWSHDKAMQLIQDGSGVHFDPQVVVAFVEVIDEIVEGMAAEGIGPLAMSETNNQKNANSKADQAARDIQRASSELWALYEVAQTLSSSLGLQETLDILARKLEGILPGTACLFLLKQDETELVAHAAVGVNREFFEGCRTIDATSTSLRVAESRGTYMGPYDSDDLMLRSSQISQWTTLESALIVPIIHQGEVLGTINLYHPDPEAFGNHDRQLLETIAERAAMALYNGLLFDRTRSHALTDPLTGLYNLRYLTQYVEERCVDPLRGSSERAGQNNPNRSALETTAELVQDIRHSERFAVLCLDLDSFKPINDNFGHQKGDQVLRDLSRIFKSTVRDEDIVARYGGDEFLIVLQESGATEAQGMAERLKVAVENYDPGLIHPKLGSLHLGVSVGYACYPTDGLDCATLLASADSCMYGDKTERKLGRLADQPRMRDTVLPGEELVEIPKAA